MIRRCRFHLAKLLASSTIRAIQTLDKKRLPKAGPGHPGIDLCVVAERLDGAE